MVNDQEITEALNLLIQSQNWIARQRVIKKNEDALLNQRALSMLDMFLRDNVLDVNTKSAIEQCKDILSDCISRGINLAFDKYTPNLPQDINEILPILDSFQSTTDIDIEIFVFEKAIEYTNMNLNPSLWVSLHCNLGTLFLNYDRYDPGYAKEEAIETFSKVIDVAHLSRHPEEQGSLLNGMAVAYANRKMGDKDENQEKAIEYYKQALAVTSKTQMPVLWGRINQNLGNAYVRADSASLT